MKNRNKMKKYLMLCFSMLGVMSISLSPLKAQDTTSNETLEQDFLNKAVSATRFEIALGSQAMERSDNDAVKQFAQMIVTDHSRILEELELAAVAKKLMLPNAIAENHASILKSIGGISGNDFNNAFKEVMIKSHEDAIALFDLAAGDAGLVDPELKAWAAQKVPALKSHLEKAKALQVNAAAAAASTTDSVTGK